MMSQSIVELILALVKAGVEEAPVIIDAVNRASRHEDPLDALTTEKVEDIVRGGLQLPVLIAAAKVRAEAMAARLPVAPAPEVTVTP